MLSSLILMAETSAADAAAANSAAGSLIGGGMEGFNTGIQYVVQVGVGLFHLMATVVIVIGVFKAVVIYLMDALFGRPSAEAIEESRLELGHALSLGLGLLIGASVLQTTVAPTWNEIGQLASIIAIRTVLNQVLLLEIRRQKYATPSHTERKPEG